MGVGMPSEDWQEELIVSGPYVHDLAPFSTVNGGAEEYAVRRGQIPLINFRGPARIAGQFLAFNPDVRISLHPTGAPQGLPFENGNLYIQDSENNGTDGLPEGGV
jgi:hypothetical protein